MDWQRRATALGFEHVGTLPVQALECLPEVREMCAADRCHAYGRRWTCPPGCGTLEDCARRLAGYRSGLLVQSTGRLEDDFDAETMLETERIHKERFAAHWRRKPAGPRGLSPSGSGDLHAVSRVYLSGPALPVPGPGGGLYGSVRPSGLPSV